MKRLALSFAALLFLTLACLLAHWALIEAGREVIVLRTEEADGTWLEGP